ncbi:MAG: UpxY family transcription antiterminator [Chthoniobacterales bacterium]|jgi:transcriptional antiterminator NusG
MATSTRAIQSIASPQGWISNDPQASWYAVYTHANHEKKAAAEISRRGVESFLPLYRTARRWSDRRIELDMPLFQGYVFVHLALCDRLKVLQVPGVVRLVGFGGLAAPLPEEQIDTLRSGLNGYWRAEPHPYLAVGRRVRLKSGPLAGIQGILLRRKGNFRIVISIDLIHRAVVVDADAADVEAIR